MNDDENIMHCSMTTNSGSVTDIKDDTGICVSLEKYIASEDCICSMKMLLFAGGNLWRSHAVLIDMRT